MMMLLLSWRRSTRLPNVDVASLSPELLCFLSCSCCFPLPIVWARSLPINASEILGLGVGLATFVQRQTNEDPTDLNLRMASVSPSYLLP